MVLPEISFRARRVFEQIGLTHRRASRRLDAWVKRYLKLLVLWAVCVVMTFQVYAQYEKHNRSTAQAQEVVAPTTSPLNVEKNLQNINKTLAVERSLAEAQTDPLNWWANVASIIGVFLSLMGVVLSLFLAGIGVYVAWHLHKRSSAEAQEGLKQTLDKIHDAVYELDKIDYEKAKETVAGWTQNIELTGMEWFSPFSAVPLFWHNLADAHKVIEMLASQRVTKKRLANLNLQHITVMR